MEGKIIPTFFYKEKKADANRKSVCNCTPLIFYVSYYIYILFKFVKTIL